MIRDEFIDRYHVLKCALKNPEIKLKDSNDAMNVFTTSFLSNDFAELSEEYQDRLNDGYYSKFITSTNSQISVIQGLLQRRVVMNKNTEEIEESKELDIVHEKEPIVKMNTSKYIITQDLIPINFSIKETWSYKIISMIDTKEINLFQILLTDGTQDFKLGYYEKDQLQPIISSIVEFCFNEIYILNMPLLNDGVKISVFLEDDKDKAPEEEPTAVSTETEAVKKEIVKMVTKEE